MILSWLAHNWLLVAGVLALVFAATSPVAFWKAKAWALAAAIGLWGWSGHAAHDALQVRYAQLEAQAAKDAADAAHARAERAEAIRKWDAERAGSVGRIGEAYEKGKHDAQIAGQAAAADLRSGALRLRKLWHGCEARSAGAVPDATASAGERDAEAVDRAEAAGRIVRIGAEADAQLRACQAILEDDRRVMP